MLCLMWSGAFIPGDDCDDGCESDCQSDCHIVKVIAIVAVMLLPQPSHGCSLASPPSLYFVAPPEQRCSHHHTASGTRAGNLWTRGPTPCP